MSKLALKNAKISVQSKIRAIINKASSLDDAQVKIDKLCDSLTIDGLLGRTEETLSDKDYTLLETIMSDYGLDRTTAMAMIKAKNKAAKKAA